ncbi:hypothetical protein RCL1_000823 [Eukaryota sp. TZLM3-RCL]
MSQSVNSPPSNKTHPTKAIWGFAEPFSSWSHLLAAAAFIPLMVRMFLSLENKWQPIFCCIIYSFTVLFCLSMSGVYHLLSPFTMGRLVLRRLDHAAIFCLIAGTFTGVHGVVFQGPARWIPIIFQWIVGITGLVLKTVFFKKVSDKFGLILYLTMGWFGVVSFIMLLVTFKNAVPLLLLIGGGVSYSIGGIVDGFFEKKFVVVKGFFMSHEFFHVAVIAGLLFHYELIIYGAKHLV